MFGSNEESCDWMLAMQDERMLTREQCLGWCSLPPTRRRPDESKNGRRGNKQLLSGIRHLVP